MFEKRIIDILKRSKNKGLSITELVNLSKYPRSRIRTILARLDGASKVCMRRVGMAKLYFLKC